MKAQVKYEKLLRQHSSAGVKFLFTIQFVGLAEQNEANDEDDYQGCYSQGLALQFQTEDSVGHVIS